MRRNWRLLDVCYFGLACAVMSGCDSTPNPEFEKELNEKMAAVVGDPYGMLDRAPTPARYEHSKAEERAGVARRDALSYAAAYETMLASLDTEPAVLQLQELSTGCRGLYKEVLVFHATPPQDLAASSRALLDRLNECRDRAIEAADRSDEAVARQAQLLRRFASSGMVLLGAATVAHGAEAEGLRLWNPAVELSVEDRPGFKLNARSILTGN